VSTDIPIHITRWVRSRGLRADSAWPACDDPDYVIGRQHGRPPERLDIPASVGRHFAFLLRMGFECFTPERMLDLRAVGYGNGTTGVLVGYDLAQLFVCTGPVPAVAATTGEIVDALADGSERERPDIGRFGTFPLVAGDPETADAVVARHAGAFRRVMQQHLRGGADLVAMAQSARSEVARLRPESRSFEPASERERVELMITRGELTELHAELDAAVERLRAGDTTAAGVVLAYLDVDPWYFRSGYRKGRLARALGHVALAPDDRALLNALTVRWLDDDLYNAGADFCRVAGRNATNALRRQVVAQLHRPRPGASRALLLLPYIRRPGLNARSRRRILELLAETPTWQARDLARRMFSAEWRSELESMARVHGPLRAAAKAMLMDAESRRQRRDRR
jgi:hypothetical protein